MINEERSLGLRLLSAAVLLFVSGTFAGAQNEVVLHRFHFNDGAYPVGALIADAQQNLYGVTSWGGSGLCTYYPLLQSGCGTIFQLTRTPGGGWKQTVVYDFQGGTDGAFPRAGLVFDQAGNLYGTTMGGGLSQACCGTVFELSPPVEQGGDWTETILYRFTAYTDGALPLGRLVFDQAGNLYGTAWAGGQTFDCCGTAFELSPPAQPGGTWTETTLHIFNTRPGDGYSPDAGLTFDQSGALYGTTYAGGKYNWGTVFRLRPPQSPDSRWIESIYSFKGGVDDASDPQGELVWVRGKLIGTASGGGENSAGTVFQITSSQGAITANILYTFSFGNFGASGFIGPGIVADSRLNLYGTVGLGGNGNCEDGDGCGIVFQLVPPTPPGGNWTENTLYEFQGGSDGEFPYGTLLLGGNWLLGLTTRGGGSPACNPAGFDGCGTVFAVRK